MNQLKSATNALIQANRKRLEGLFDEELENALPRAIERWVSAPAGLFKEAAHDAMQMIKDELKKRGKYHE